MPTKDSAARRTLWQKKTLTEEEEITFQTSRVLWTALRSSFPLENSMLINIKQKCHPNSSPCLFSPTLCAEAELIFYYCIWLKNHIAMKEIFGIFTRELSHSWSCQCLQQLIPTDLSQEAPNKLLQSSFCKSLKNAAWVQKVLIKQPVRRHTWLFQWQKEHTEDSAIFLTFLVYK